MVVVVIPVIKHVDPKLILHEMLQKAYPKLEEIKEYCTGCPEVKDGAHITEILKRPDYNRSDGLPLHIASCQADSIDPNIIAYLIELCPEAMLIQNKFGMNPLHCAALNSKRPQLEIIRLLCECSNYQTCMQPNKQGMLPMHICLKSPRDFERGILNVILAEYMKEQLMFQDSYGYVPLHQAVANKKTTSSLLEYLLSCCPRSAQVQDASGSLPLHWLLSSFDFPDVLMLRLLLMYHPASAMIKDKEGHNPLSRYMFRVSKNPQVIQILLTQRQFVLDNPSCLVLLEHNNSIYSQSVSSSGVMDVDVESSLASITGQGQGQQEQNGTDTDTEMDMFSADGSSDVPRKGSQVYGNGSSVRRSRSGSPQGSIKSTGTGGGSTCQQRTRRLTATTGHSPAHSPVYSPCSSSSSRKTAFSPTVGRAKARTSSVGSTSLSPSISPGRRTSSSTCASVSVSGKEKSLTVTSVRRPSGSSNGISSFSPSTSPVATNRRKSSARV